VSINSNASADAANTLTALQKTSSYEQAAYVEKGGWAIMPGSKAVDSRRARSLRRHSQ
jgi:hypothetical protein